MSAHHSSALLGRSPSSWSARGRRRCTATHRAKTPSKPSCLQATSRRQGNTAAPVEGGQLSRSLTARRRGAQAVHGGCASRLFRRAGEAHGGSVRAECAGAQAAQALATRGNCAGAWAAQTRTARGQQTLQVRKACGRGFPCGRGAKP